VGIVTLAILSVMACSPMICADNVSSSGVSLPTRISPASHLTDAQDRLGSGQLLPGAEARSEANALYAEAMLLPEGLAGGQQQALGLFRQIVALDPSFIDAQIKLANILLQSGQLDQALVQLQAAAASHPDSIPIEVALGYTQRLRGDNDEARRLCTHALTRDPTQPVAMRVLLEIAGDQGGLTGGVLRIEDILKSGSAHVPASAWLDLARLYLEVARTEISPPEAGLILKTRLPLLQQAASVPPPEIETLSLLAEAYRGLGRETEALETLRRAYDLEPSNVDLALRCADLEAQLGETDDEIRDYENVYQLNPALPGLREKLENLYEDHQRFGDAARLLQEAVAESPKDTGLQIDLGIAYEESHHPQEAQACFRRVFDALDCPPEAYVKLALFQQGHKELEQSAETLTLAEARFPRSARIRFFEAVQNRYEKNYGAALASLAEVRVLASGAQADALDSDYYLESASTLHLAGQKDRLETVLREGLGKYPDNPDLMNELAYFWADEGRHLTEALALSQRAAALEPDNGPIVDTWGWVYFRMGHAQDALPYLQRAAVMTNNDPVVLQHVGDAYLKLGLRREAIVAWARALEKDPRNGDLANRIDAALAQAKNAHLRSAPNP
jgi:tetratricopeptide (TPR) repeat protein